MSDPTVTTPGQPSVYVRLERVSKAFGGVQALDGVEIAFVDGEIHGLLGENGSGKSTLIKILSGFHTPDTGKIYVRGEEIGLPMKPGGYRDLGFAFVHQELGLIPSLSVVENVRMERIAAGRGMHMSWQKEERFTRELFERFGVEWIAPRENVIDLRPIDRALVAIVRALSHLEPDDMSDSVPGRLLVLDEPTAFLSRTEADQLFATLREISAAGTSVVFVSHKLYEVLDLTHRVTVLRDGRVAGTMLTSEATEDDLARMVLGRQRTQLEAAGERRSGSRASAAAEPLLSLRELAVSARLDRIDVDVWGGEVLGLTGLEGSGFEEVLYALFGLSSYRVTGHIRLDGIEERLGRLTPETAMALGIALVPGERQAGCVANLSIQENLAAPTLDEFWHYGHLSWRRINAAARGLAEQFDIRPREVEREVSMLSGGNQQKVVLAKWLQTDPTVLLLHEPTQGVDIGARAEIFRFILNALREDNCVIVASTDYEQLEMLCTRLLVIGDGRVTADLYGEEITQDRIAEECLVSARAAQSVGSPA
jgi:ribose transport system ATP-binding protein